MAFTKATAIISDKSIFDPNKHRAAVEQALDNAQSLIETGFQQSVSTWQHKPAFVKTRTIGERSMYTQDRQYRWVSDGTSIRYATMTKDFSPKTRPGYLGSTAGRGGVWFVNRSKPKKGIEGRHFEALIQKEVEAYFPQIVQAEINRVINAQAPTGFFGRVRGALRRLFGS